MPQRTPSGTQRGRCGWLVVCLHARMTYACDAGPFSPPSNHPLRRQVMGVYDRDSGRLSLVPLLGDRVLRMEPRLPGLQYDTVYGADVEGANTEETRELLRAENKRCVGW